MNNSIDFLSAALPWVCMGLLLAVFFARSSRRKKDGKAENNYGSEGMALGMCFGSAIGTSLGSNTGLGMIAGLLLGLAVGSSIEKKEDEN